MVVVIHLDVYTENADEEIIINPFRYWTNKLSTHELCTCIRNNPKATAARCKAKGVAGVNGEQVVW
jgi:hypothetical protein